MRFVYVIFLFTLFSVFACSHNSNADKKMSDAEKRGLEVSKSIDEANKTIEENMRLGKIEQVERKSFQLVKSNFDGPYPSDKFSIKPTGRFFILSLYAEEEDSVWLTIDVKLENDIVEKYPKLQAYKVRPDWIKKEDWVEIYHSCIKNKMVFDLNDEPKGWLLENQSKLM